MAPTKKSFKDPVRTNADTKEITQAEVDAAQRLTPQPAPAPVPAAPAAPKKA